MSARPGCMMRTPPGLTAAVLAMVITILAEAAAGTVIVVLADRGYRNDAIIVAVAVLIPILALVTAAVLCREATPAATAGWSFGLTMAVAATIGIAGGSFGDLVLIGGTLAALFGGGGALVTAIVRALRARAEAAAALPAARLVQR